MHTSTRALLTGVAVAAAAGMLILFPPFRIETGRAQQRDSATRRTAARDSVRAELIRTDSTRIASEACLPYRRLREFASRDTALRKDRTIPLRETDCAVRAGSIARAAWAAKGLMAMRFSVKEAHDEQPFPDGTGGYGPLVRIYSVPQLAHYATVRQISEQWPIGTLAAVVEVEGSEAVLPASYADLNLRSGLNCLWLAHDPDSSDDSGWRGVMASPNEGECDRHAVPNPTNPQHISALRVKANAAFNKEDYPRAARFSEIGRDTQSIAIGVKCLRGWCLIGPRSNEPRLPEQALDKEEKIKGWHDQQMLTDTTPAGTLRRGVYAKVVPIKNVDALADTDFKAFRPVARIYIAGDPTGTKYAKWGLKPGWNTLEIKGDPAVENWQGQIRAPHTPKPIPMATVIRQRHFDEPVPGTARFRWIGKDPGVWIPCGQACCDAVGAVEQM